jgi:hypothetical protein
MPAGLITPLVMVRATCGGCWYHQGTCSAGQSAEPGLLVTEGARMILAAQDIPEIVAALAEFVTASEPYIIGFDPPLDLRAIAAAVRLLPAVLDVAGCLGLRRSGAVASFRWDEPYVLRPEWDARIRNMAYHQASLKYPALALLVPRRPANAVPCLHCGASGRCSGLPARLADGVVCYCGGLGWLPGEDA